MSETASKASSYGAGAAHEGALQARGRRFAICAARFNDGVVSRLIAGARQALREAGAGEGDVELYRCPGAMELAGLARRLVETGRYAGVVCLGAVIRGGTPHFDLVGLFARHAAQFQQVLQVPHADALALLDGPDHQRLGKRRFVGFVVSTASIAVHVDDHVALEHLAEVEA